MGNGKVYYDSGRSRYFIDLFVVATYNAPETAWRRSFDFASDILFHATKGQMQLGQISFLNNSSLTYVDDVELQDSPDPSTAPICSGRDCDDEELIGYMTLRERAREQPIESAHELGHFVCCLEDEYFARTYGVCTHDASTHQCLMEYNYGYGIILDGHGVPLPDVHQPSIIVTDYCDASSHLSCDGLSSCSSICNLFNAQEYAHGKSCWESLIEFFCEMKLPDDPALPTNTLDPISWITRNLNKKYAVNIVGADTFNVLGALPEVKNAAKVWVRYVAGSGDQLAVLFDLSTDLFVRDMGYIESGFAADQLILSIDAIGRDVAFKKMGAEDEYPFLGLDQFDSNTGSYQFIVVAAPGDFSSPVSDDEWQEIAMELEKKQIQLLVTTLGGGKFAQQISQIEHETRWIELTIIPPNTDQPELQNLDFQSQLAELFFLKAPGYGLVTSHSGILPFIDVCAKDERCDENQKGIFRFEERSEGFDLPVLIESDAETAFFGLSESKRGDIGFSLIRPNGEVIDRNTNPSPGLRMSIDAENVSWFHVSGAIGGRWLIRLDRIASERELPFDVFAGVHNDSIFLRTRADVDGNLVSFECMSHHKQRLDFVQSMVDVFRAEDFARNQTPFKSITLRRQTKRNPFTDRISEVSTGSYRGSIEVPNGEYVAVFRVSNEGTAVFANNPTGFPIGDLQQTELGDIPAFSRIDRKYFSVSGKSKSR